MPPIEPDTPTLVVERTEDGVPIEATVASGEDSRVSDPFPDLRRGDVLGRYVVLDILGHGGMGVVYAAYDPELDRKVALKLVKCDLSVRRGSAGRSRLLREAQALARLTHPNVVGVYDVGTWESSVFVAMEFIEGETVARWIDRRHTDQAPPWREVLDVMLPAGRGLQGAHAAGIVHRDFKPENVMLSDSGRVLVLDFGLATASEPGSESLSISGPVTSSSRSQGSMQTRLTATGSVMGTPAYMSPEQLGAGLSNDASDQFSFCVSLYHALYGSRPFAGDTLPLLTDSVLDGRIEPAPRGSKVPTWLRRVVLRGLSTAANERYASMAELLADLGRDPARLRKRILMGGGAAGLLAGAWLLAGHVAGPDDSCVQVDQAMNGAWGPTQREALERAFRHDAKTYSEQSIDRVETALESYATRWVELRRAACEVGRQAGTDAGRDAGLSAACLDQRLRRFDALVRLLGDADQEMVAKAMSAVQQLPDPSQCHDAERYRRAAPMPDDPQQQEQVESVRLRMAEVHALAITGRLQEANEELIGLLAEARALGFEPLVAEVLQVSGGTLAQLGQYPAAQQALEEGLLLARAHDLEELEEELLSPLVFIHTSYTGHFELAAWHAQVLEVLVERLDPRPSHKARVLVDRARLEQRQGRTAAAIDLFERAIELFNEEDAAGQSLVLAYDSLASSYMEAERFDEAAGVLKRAEELAATALGADHPHRGNLLAHSARVEAGRGNHAGAAIKLRAALTVFEGAYGGFHPNVSAVLNGLALQLEALGKPDEAVTSFRRALELVVRAFGEEHAQVAIIKSNLGNALRRMGHAEDALSLHREARSIRERGSVGVEARYEILDNIGDDLRVLGRCEEAEDAYRAANGLRESEGDFAESGAAYAVLGIGLCQWKTGALGRAQQTLEGAVAQGRGEEKDDSWSRETLALARFGLAMVLRERDMGHERSTVLAEQAKTHWAKDPVQYREQLEQLDAWEAGGPATMPVY